MSHGTCQLPLRVCVLSWLPWPARPLLVSLTSPLCCSESEDSSDLNSRTCSSTSLCFLTCSFMSLSCPMYCTLSLTVCKCTPCQQSKPHQCNRFFFSRSHDHYSQAFIDRCWTSLRVIVIVSLSLCSHKFNKFPLSRTSMISLTIAGLSKLLVEARVLRCSLLNGSTWSTEKNHEKMQRKVRYLFWDRAQIEEGGNGGAAQQRSQGRMEICG